MNTAVEGGAYYPSNIPYNEACASFGGGFSVDAERAKQANMRTGARFDFSQLSPKP
ncbi:MAG: hypothetical protein R2751_03840 [Bacteroidales bacterium]